MTTDCSDDLVGRYEMRLVQKDKYIREAHELIGALTWQVDNLKKQLATANDAVIELRAIASRAHT